MKEEMIRLAKHYKKTAETASGMVAKNAQKNYDEVIKGHPYILEELKEKKKNDSSK